MIRSRLALIAASAIIATPLAFNSPALRAAQAKQDPVHFTAIATNMGSAPDLRPTAASSAVDITVERWSTDEERDRFFESLTQSPDKLLAAFQNAKRVGFIRTPDQRGYDLKYARQTMTDDGGRRVIIATDRPMSFWEITNRPRTADYPFAVIELRIGADGKGEGKMSIATKITTENDHSIALENYLSEPVMLQDVRVAKK